MHGAGAAKLPPQPNLVPTRLRWSRNTQSSGVSGSRSSWCARLFTVSEMTAMRVYTTVIDTLALIPRRCFAEDGGVMDFGTNESLTSGRAD